MPFEEDSRNPKIWFVDHNFHEKMFAMFRKVNASERVVGWYSSGPRIRPNDIDVNELFRRYCRDPVLVVIETKPSSDVGLPTKAYVSVEKVSAVDGTSSMQFEHIESSIGAVEAEEVGVEHLLRDVHDSSVSSLTAEVRNKVASLRALAAKLHEMELYLDMVVRGEMPGEWLCGGEGFSFADFAKPSLCSEQGSAGPASGGVQLAAQSFQHRNGGGLCRQKQRLDARALSGVSHSVRRVVARVDQQQTGKPRFRAQDFWIR